MVSQGARENYLNAFKAVDLASLEYRAEFHDEQGVVRSGRVISLDDNLVMLGSDAFNGCFIFSKSGVEFLKLGEPSYMMGDTPFYNIIVRSNGKEYPVTVSKLGENYRVSLREPWVPSGSLPVEAEPFEYDAAAWGLLLFQIGQTLEKGILEPAKRLKIDFRGTPTNNIEIEKQKPEILERIANALETCEKLTEFVYNARDVAKKLGYSFEKMM